MRSLFRFWRNTDDHDGDDAGAGVVPSHIRRNGNRLQTVHRVSWRRRPHWSAAKGQSRLFHAFRATICLALCLVTFGSVPAAAQSGAPTVTMRVTLPDGRSEELAAPESGLATVTLGDGTEYGFRPTIQDSMPWNRIVVTIFRMATTSAPTQALGEVEVKRGGSAVEAKTTPAFKVAVAAVASPGSPTATN